MNNTTHAITGAVLGIAIGNPTGAFIVGVISHVVLDYIPHTDQGTFLREDDHKKWPLWVWYSVYLDVFISGLAILIFMNFTNPYNWPLLFFGALGGVIIDYIDNVPYWNKKLQKTKIGNKFHKIHSKYHHTISSKHWFWGVLTQLIIILGGVWFLLQKL